MPGGVGGAGAAPIPIPVMHRDILHTELPQFGGDGGDIGVGGQRYDPVDRESQD